MDWGHYASTAFIAVVLITFAGVIITILANLRIVVGTNDVNIVQRGKTTTSYGKGLPHGNVFYKWPSWVPALGVQVTVLPVSVYSLALKDYAAYDKGRVPFIIDVIGFFRVSDPLVASERIPNFDELRSQMTGILQGAIRSILASSEIEEILEGRSRFGEMFTTAVDHQLESWGITSVKTIELMDIRDAANSKVIDNIMAKKKSLIEMQSRVAVATNSQTAKIAEVEAARQIGIAEQEAMLQVGQRTADKDKGVGIQQELAKQSVLDQTAITMAKDVEARRVRDVGQAEIERGVAVVTANRAKEVMVIAAEADKQRLIVVAEGAKQQVVLGAEGTKDQMVLHAEGVLAEGTAGAKATELMELAPVTAQLKLAAEIGQNMPYMNYLIGLKDIERGQLVGVAQSRALEKAQLKIFSSNGQSIGTGLSAAVEAFALSDAGQKLVDRAGGTK